MSLQRQSSQPITDTDN